MKELKDFLQEIGIDPNTPVGNYLLIDLIELYLNSQNYWWVVGNSQINRSDLKDKDKCSEALDESLENLFSKVKEFAMVWIHEDPKMIIDNNLNIRTELRVLDTRTNKL